MVGAAYDRTLYGFELETTTEDDERLIRHLNSQRNRRRFHLLYRNCADFARSIVNFYYPHAIRRNFIADVGISTPKQSAKALVRYGQRRPELRLSYFVVPQISGERRSNKVRGVSEFLIRSPKYAVPLLVLQPWVAATAVAAYVTQGRFDLARQAQTFCEPGTRETETAGASSGARSIGTTCTGLTLVASRSGM